MVHDGKPHWEVLHELLILAVVTYNYSDLHSCVVAL